MMRDSNQQTTLKDRLNFNRNWTVLLFLIFPQTQTQQQRQPQPLAQIQVQPNRPSPEEDSSSEIIFQTVSDKGHGKSDYDYHDRKKKKIHKQDHKQKNYPNATGKQRQKNSVDRQKRNEKKITTPYEKEKDTGEVIQSTNTSNTSKPNQYQHPLPPFYPPPTYMYQMPMPMRAHIPMQMGMTPMPPHQMYLQYPPTYMHPNQYPFNNGGPIKQIPMPMNINQYQINNSIPQHQQISIPPQSHQIPMQNPNNQYKISQNMQAREYTTEKHPESLYKSQQIPLPQNNNSYPSYQINYPTISNQGYSQNVDKTREFGKYHDFKSEKNEKIDKRKEVLNDVKKELKKNLKAFTNQEQSDILQALKGVIKFNNKKNQPALQKQQTIQASIQAMEINSYERSLITLEKLLVSGQHERRQFISKLLETLQLNDISTGLKERRIANKLIGDQAELKKLAQVFARDPRKMIS